MPEWIPLLFTPEMLISLVTLSAMEIILGVDNVIFIAILAGKLPPEQQPQARKLGLTLALFIRIGLLFGISWLAGLTTPFFTLPILNKGISGRDLILLVGGLFLMWKSTHEIYEKLEVGHKDDAPRPGKGAFGAVLAQILMMDIIFSLDSVITAVGMVKGKEGVPGSGAAALAVMVAAMVVSMVFMLFFAGAISDFVNRHPSMKILALSFLLMIGVMLVIEGWGGHVNKGYIYFAMAFSVGIEVLNMRFRRKQAQKPVELHSVLEASPETQVKI
jgi:predicted tellurium resistance membrane protein TerC